MPQVKRPMALLYAVNPGGADHTVSEHSTSYTRFADGVAALGLLDPQPPTVLNAEMVRYAAYSQQLISCVDAVCVCKFVYGPAWQLYDLDQWVEALRAITGDDALRDRLSREGPERAAAFTWRRCAEATLAALIEASKC